MVFFIKAINFDITASNLASFSVFYSYSHSWDAIKAPYFTGFCTKKGYVSLLIKIN